MQNDFVTPHLFLLRPSHPHRLVKMHLGLHVSQLRLILPPRAAADEAGEHEAYAPPQLVVLLRWRTQARDPPRMGSVAGEGSTACASPSPACLPMVGRARSSSSPFGRCPPIPGGAREVRLLPFWPRELLSPARCHHVCRPRGKLAHRYRQRPRTKRHGTARLWPGMHDLHRRGSTEHE